MTLRVHPQPLAWAFIGLLIVLLLGAAQYANNLGFFFAFWLAASAMLGLWRARRQLLHLKLQPLPVLASFEGQPARLFLRLQGPPGMELEAQPADCPTAQALRLDQATETVTLLLPARQRGVYPLSDLQLYTQDPLGLTRWERHESLRGHYWVYPSPRGERPLPTATHRDLSNSVKPSMAFIHDNQDDFAGLKPYQAGDPPARLHWRALARSGNLQTKHFNNEEQGDGPRILDERMLLALPREARLRQLTAWVLACEAQGEAYSLSLAHGPHLAAGCGPQHQTQALRLLAEAPRS